MGRYRQQAGSYRSVFATNLSSYQEPQVVVPIDFKVSTDNGPTRRCSWVLYSCVLLPSQKTHRTPALYGELFLVERWA